MKSKPISIVLLSGLLLIGGAGAAVAKVHIPNPFHRKHHHSSPKTNVTMEQAQAVAVRKVPGTVADSKTETVKGKEVYWFEINNSKNQKEQVWVNESGKVTKVMKEKMPKPMKGK